MRGVRVHSMRCKQEKVHRQVVHLCLKSSNKCSISCHIKFRLTSLHTALRARFSKKASMAKLVRRYTSNVAILSSTLSGSTLRFFAATKTNLVGAA